MLVGLDRFKPLNDTHGHGAGDAALKAIAHRLAIWARSESIAARLGGDEFATVLPAPTDPGAELATLHRALTGRLAYDGKRLSVRTSIGAYLARAGASMPLALGAADAAMYAAKRAGGDWRLASVDLGAMPSPSRWRRHRPASKKEPA